MDENEKNTSTCTHIYIAFKSIANWMFRIAVWCMCVYVILTIASNCFSEYTDYLRKNGCTEYTKYAQFYLALQDGPGNFACLIMSLCAILGMTARTIQVLALAINKITE